MHESTRDFVERVVNQHVLDMPGASVVDLGAHDVNGTNRDFFTHANYLGIDFRDGPNVDLCCHSWATGLPSESVDVVLSTEQLEHDEHPQKTFDEIRRILRRDGWLIVTTRAPGYPLHEYPGDYWRFTLSDLQQWFFYAGVITEHLENDPQVPGAFGAGRLVLEPEQKPPPLKPAPTK